MVEALVQLQWRRSWCKPCKTFAHFCTLLVQNFCTLLVQNTLLADAHALVQQGTKVHTHPRAWSRLVESSLDSSPASTFPSLPSFCPSLSSGSKSYRGIYIDRNFVGQWLMRRNSDITLAHCWGFGDNWKWWPILAQLFSDWLLGWVGFSTILRRMAFPWRFFSDILVDLTQVCTQRWHLLSQSSWEKSPLLIRGPLLPSTGSNEHKTIRDGAISPWH